VAFSLALTFLVSLGVDQVRLVDASRDAARAVAAGSSLDAVTAQARRTAPGDARVTIQRDCDLVEVTVTSHLGGPGWLLVPVPGRQHHQTVTIVRHRDQPWACSRRPPPQWEASAASRR